MLSHIVPQLQVTFIIVLCSWSTSRNTGNKLVLQVPARLQDAVNTVSNNNTQQSATVIVIGAGMAGLAAARQLSDQVDAPSLAHIGDKATETERKPLQHFS